MSRTPNKRGPVAVTTGASENAVRASVTSTYFNTGPDGKAIDLVSVPRVWIEDAVQLLIDALDHADCRQKPEDSL